jgi:hypothetical protein
MCDRYGAAAFGAPWHTGGDANAPAVLETLCSLRFFGNCPLSLRFRLEAVDQIRRERRLQESSALRWNCSLLKRADRALRCSEHRRARGLPIGGGASRWCSEPWGPATTPPRGCLPSEASSHETRRSEPDNARPPERTRTWPRSFARLCDLAAVAFPFPGAFATSGTEKGVSCGAHPAPMALHQIYATDWGQTIDETVRQDETSRRLADTGNEAVIAERAARCGWRLSWQSCDVRAAKCVAHRTHPPNGNTVKRARSSSPAPPPPTLVLLALAVCTPKKSSSTRWTSGIDGRIPCEPARCPQRW